MAARFRELQPGMFPCNGIPEQEIQLTWALNVKPKTVTSERLLHILGRCAEFGNVDARARAAQAALVAALVDEQLTARYSDLLEHLKAALKGILGETVTVAVKCATKGCARAHFIPARPSAAPHSVPHLPLAPPVPARFLLSGALFAGDNVDKIEATIGRAATDLTESDESSFHQLFYKTPYKAETDRLLAEVQQLRNELAAARSLALPAVPVPALATPTLVPATSAPYPASSMPAPVPTTSAPDPAASMPTPAPVPSSDSDPTVPVPSLSGSPASACGAADAARSARAAAAGAARTEFATSAAAGARGDSGAANGANMGTPAGAAAPQPSTAEPRVTLYTPADPDDDSSSGSSSDSSYRPISKHMRAAPASHHAQAPAAAAAAGADAAGAPNGAGRADGAAAAIAAGRAEGPGGAASGIVAAGTHAADAHNSTWRTAGSTATTATTATAAGPSASTPAPATPTPPPASHAHAPHHVPAAFLVPAAPAPPGGPLPAIFAPSPALVPAPALSAARNDDNTMGKRRAKRLIDASELVVVESKRLRSTGLQENLRAVNSVAAAAEALNWDPTTSLEYEVVITLRGGVPRVAAAAAAPAVADSSGGSSQATANSIESDPLDDML